MRLLDVAGLRKLHEFGGLMSMIADTLSAYERWAPLYPPMPHNPLMRSEQQAMMEFWPEVAGVRALDLACGTGRYAALLRQAGAAELIALDFCIPMLMQVPVGLRVCASMMKLPFPDGVFDVVVSGLALGHADGVDPWMAEIARVLQKGGTLLYSDFHPEAARAGLTRSFKDLDEQTCSVPHHTYPVSTQLDAAAAAGLRVEVFYEVRVGKELREPFAKSERFYRQWDGLPIVLVVRAQK
jgi:malonyl-CoA O-methyltransferase